MLRKSLRKNNGPSWGHVEHLIGCMSWEFPFLLPIQALNSNYILTICKSYSHRLLWAKMRCRALRSPWKSCLWNKVGIPCMRRPFLFVTLWYTNMYEWKKGFYCRVVWYQVEANLYHVHCAIVHFENGIFDLFCCLEYVHILNSMYKCWSGKWAKCFLTCFFYLISFKTTYNSSFKC
jgi:hypothetical protein